MKQKTAQKLLKKVVADYDNIADDFNQTRQHGWKEFESFLPHIKDGDHLADLGCGNGRLQEYLRKHRELNYTGIDNSKELLKHAKGNFMEGDLLKIPLKDNSQDVAAAIASFHHIPSKELRKKAAKEIARIIKKDGKLLITVWNLFQPRYKKYIWRSRLKSLVSAYDARDTFIPWGKSGVDRYYYAFKAAEIRKILEEHFEILEEKIGNNITLICRKK
ncbi:class I SAM-dependent methyltransferase [Candidatus Gracilibacteria bacterium]|nr:class I SAM-dependent methyltransferase [Candidatus Gracilibacteria bacterium]